MSSDDEGVVDDGNINYKSICCENIPENFLDKLIAKKHFSKFGKINRFILRPKRLLCTVEYEREEDARNAYENGREYNGYYFDIRYATHEVAHTQNTEEWVDPEVQAELDAMGNVVRNPSRVQQTQQQPQRMKFLPSARVPKSILKPAITSATMPPVNIEIPKIDIGVKQELEMILREQAMNVEDKYKILDARDKLIRLTTVRTTDIKKAVSTKGTCPDMCPEKERLLREAKRQVSSFEMDEERNTMNHKIAIKEYSRSSADQEAPLAHELRPEPVLKMTMDYLMHRIMDYCDDPNINLGDWYHFVWDRTRSIRKDITQQELCSLESVKLVEQCARFHIHCAARLIAEDPSVFDQKINTENLTKCLQTLKYMYNDLRLKRIKCPNEPEFRGYVILLNLNDGKFLSDFKNLEDEIQNSKQVREALSFYLAIDTRNYVKFFKLIKQTTYMNACILLRYFNQVRDMAIRIIMKAYNSPRFYSMPLVYLKNILAFESEEETVSFLNHYGLECDNNKVTLDKNMFYEPESPYAMDRSYIVEDKRYSTIGEAICGQELESTDLFENYEPHDSFDEYGYLKHDALSANNQLDGDGDERGISKEMKKQVSSDPDSNLFKIPRASPPISTKQQQQFKNQTAMKSSQNTMKPSLFTSVPSLNVFGKVDSIDSNITAPVTLFGVKTSSDDNKPGMFSLPAFQNFSQKSSPTKESKASIFGGDSFLSQVLPSKPASDGNVFGFKNNFEINTSSFRADPVFSNFQTKSNFNLFNNQDTKPSSSSSITFQSSAFSKPISNENLFKQPESVNEMIKKRKEEEETERRKQLEMEEENRKRQVEIDRINIIKELKRETQERQRQQEEEERRKRIEEKEKYERKVDEINAISEKICNEILEIVCLDEVQIILEEEVARYQKLMMLLDEIQNEILDEGVDEMLTEIVEKEVAVFLKKQRTLRKYFWLWKENTEKIIKRRKLIELTPMWITEESISEQAPEFSHSQLNETLGLMKRYRSGVPEVFNLKKPHEDSIDLFALFSKELENKADFNDRGLLKSKTYFKCLISLPEEPIEYHEHENSKGFYEYMSNRLRQCITMQFFDYQYNTNKSEFLCGCQGNICICLRKVHGIFPKNEENKKVSSECDHSNAIVFIMTCSNLENSQKRLRVLLNSSRVCILQKIPVVVIVYNSILNKNEIENGLQLQDLIANDKISEYRIFELNEKQNKTNMRQVLQDTFKFLVHSFPRDCELEMQQLSSFVRITIGDEFWNRMKDSWQMNPAFNKFCTRPENVIQLYNEAIQKLIAMVEENLDDFPDFPHELKQYVSDFLPFDIPVELEYFPKEWKNFQSEKIFRIKNFLMKIQLQSFADVNLLSMELDQIEKLLLQYAEKCISLDTQTSTKSGYNAIKVLLEKLNDPILQDLPVSSRFYEISWLEIMKCISLELLLFMWNVDYQYLPVHIIYRKQSLDNFINNPWWLKIDSLRKLKSIRIPDYDEEYTNENKNENNYTDNDDYYQPDVKKLKNDFNDLDALLEKSREIVEKAEKSIEKYEKYSELSRNITQDLDIEFYRQERINQSIRRFIRENK